MIGLTRRIDLPLLWSVQERAFGLRDSTRLVHSESADGSGDADQWNLGLRELVKYRNAFVLDARVCGDPSYGRRKGADGFYLAYTITPGSFKDSDGADESPRLVHSRLSLRAWMEANSLRLFAEKFSAQPFPSRWLCSTTAVLLLTKRGPA